MNDAHSTHVREALDALAASASRPFLFPDEPAFCGTADIASPTPAFETTVVVEDDHLPPLDAVHRSGLFVCSGTILRGPLHDGSPKAFKTDLVGFPRSPDGHRNPVAPGHEILISRARNLLRKLRRREFLEHAANMNVAARSTSVLIRLVPLDAGTHTPLEALIRRRTFDFAVGIDYTLPDLSDTTLFDHIGDPLPEAPEAHVDYVCPSDLNVTRLLRRGERTGLFWRFSPGLRPGNHASPCAASCYACLDDVLPAVRIDLLGKQEAMTGTAGFASSLVNWLTGLDKIPLGDVVLKDVFGHDVAVPELLRPFLTELLGRRQNENSVLDFYRALGFVS